MPEHFNSHARVGRDGAVGGELDSMRISTHTPAWGVTAVKGVYADNFGISTHTPAWGVTKTPYAAKQWYNDFNSHARVGRDWQSRQT